MARYSFSQINTYKQCALKYRYQYVDTIKTEFVETAESILGNAVHSTLEKLYEYVNMSKNIGLDILLSFYREYRDSKISEYAGSIPTYGDFTIDDFIQRGRSYIVQYYESHSPFDNIKVIDTEMQLYFELESDIGFKGFIDRLDKQGDTFIINDYKTTKNLPSDDKDEYKDQLTLYAIGVQEKYPQYFDKLKARLYLLHFDIEDEWDITQERMQKVKEKYLSLVSQIEHKKKQYASGKKTCFEPTKSGLCRFCPFQSICPEWTYVDEDDSFVSSLGKKSLAALVDEFLDVKSQLSELKKREDGLKDTFTRYIESKYPHPTQSTYKIAGSIKDVKISLSEQYQVTDQDDFARRMKDLGLYDSYARLDHHATNAVFKNGNTQIESFDGSVVPKQSYRISLVKKT